MEIVAGFGPLHAFIGAEEGVALMDDSGKYLSKIDNKKNKNHIECCKNTKDPRCKFHLEKVDDKSNKVYIKDLEGAYLCQTQGDIKFETVKDVQDKHKFDVFTKGEVILFRANNGKYLNLNKQIIDATKDGPDASCEFTPTIGDIISPKFRIISVRLLEHNETNYIKIVGKKEIFINESSQTQKHRFNLSWTKNVIETTTWNHAWGLNAKVSGKLFVADVDVSVSYSGSYGTSSTKQKTITMGDETEITIPPNKTITVESVVSKVDNRKFPFEAEIEKTKNNGDVETFTEKGFWKGEIYEKQCITITETDIRNSIK